MDWTELIKSVGPTLAVITSAVGLVAAVERYSSVARAKRTIDWAGKALERKPSFSRSAALEGIIVYSEARLFAASRFPSGVLTLVVFGGIAIAVFGLQLFTATFNDLSEWATQILSTLIFMGALTFGVGRWSTLYYSRLILSKTYRSNPHLLTKGSGAILKEFATSWQTYTFALFLSLTVSLFLALLVFLIIFVVGLMAGYLLLAWVYFIAFVVATIFVLVMIVACAKCLKGSIEDDFLE